MYIDIKTVQEQTVVQRSFNPSQSNCETDKSRPNHEAPDLNGYVYQGTVTGASGASVSSYQMQFLHRDIVVPSYYFQVLKNGENMSLVAFPTSDQKK